MFSVIFPGQGSQAVGMGKEFYENYPVVKEIFSKANEVLKYDLTKIILEGPVSEINLTENTQPAIFLVSYSIFSVMEKEFNINLNKANYFAGHSLGEYSALACANSLGFEDAILLLSKRGKSMQSAVPVGKGSMLAVLGIDIRYIEDILNQNNDFKDCQIANDNCPGQVVISGSSNGIKNLTELLKKKSIKSIILPVSAPFHCFMMNKSTEIMTKYINETKFETPNPKIVSNVTADEKNNNEEIKKLLIKQIESKVRWRESIEYIIKKGSKEFIEIGPGKVLSGLIKRINNGVKIFNINSIKDIIDYKNQ